jgi:uncharacterized membrane protein
MTRSQQPALTAFAIGMVGRGTLALIYGDFALVWQPVPPWIPGRTVLAYGSGLIMLLGGVGLLVTRHCGMVGSHLVPIPHRLAPAEITRSPGGAADGSSLARLWRAGCASGRRGVLFAKLAELGEGFPLTLATSENGIYFAQMVFAGSLIPIGLSHIVYMKETAELVPAWLPYRVGSDYLTGAGQIACGLGVLFSIFPRVAAIVEAAMIGPCDSGRPKDTAAVDSILLELFLPGSVPIPLPSRPPVKCLVSWHVVTRGMPDSAICNRFFCSYILRSAPSSTSCSFRVSVSIGVAEWRDGHIVPFLEFCVNAPDHIVRSCGICLGQKDQELVSAIPHHRIGASD